MSGSTVVTALASGNQVNLTSKTAGSAWQRYASASYSVEQLCVRAGVIHYFRRGAFTADMTQLLD